MKTTFSLSLVSKSLLVCALALQPALVWSATLNWRGLGTTDEWGNNFNWQLGSSLSTGVPGPADTANIGNIISGAYAHLNGNTVVANLNLSGAAELSNTQVIPPAGQGLPEIVRRHALTVHGTTRLTNSSKLTIDTRASDTDDEFTTDRLEVHDSAQIPGGIFHIMELMDIDDAGATAKGTYNFYQPGKTVFTNNGTFGGSIISHNGAPIDLDGDNETGRLVRHLSRNVIDAPLTDAFDGQLEGSYDFKFPWTAGADSLITLNGGFFGDHIFGEKLTSYGDIDVPGNGIFNAELDFVDGTIRLPNNESLLLFHNTARFALTSIEGTGTLGAGQFSDLHFIGEYRQETHSLFVHEEATMETLGMATILGGNGTIDGTWTLSGNSLLVNTDLQGGGRMIVRDNATLGANATISLPRVDIQSVDGNASLVVSQGSLQTEDLHVTSRLGGTNSGTLRILTGGNVTISKPGEPQGGILNIGMTDAPEPARAYVNGVEAGNRSTLDVHGSASMGEGYPAHGFLEVAQGGLAHIREDLWMVPPNSNCCPNFSGQAHTVVGGALDGFDAELIVDDTIYLGRTLASGNNATLTINEGGIVSADTVQMREAGTLSLQGGQLKLIVLDLTRGGTLELGGGIFDVDSVLGTVDLANVTVTPGNSPGLMTVDGGLSLTDTLLEIELGGLVPVDDYDQVAVTDRANLGGSLLVSLYDRGDGAFEPQAGDQFEILTAGNGIQSEFDTLITPELPLGLNWDVSYLANSVLLSVIGNEPGDYDGDGDVDADDLERWKEEYGERNTGRSFLEWQRNYTGQVESSVAFAAVPEPSSMLLFACCLLGVVASECGLTRNATSHAAGPPIPQAGSRMAGLYGGELP